MEYENWNDIWTVNIRICFLGAEACLLAGSARNAYHTKYRGLFGENNLSCATLRKGVFAAGAALTLLSLLASILYYWAHSRADTGGWEKHRNEGVGLATSNFNHQQQGGEFGKAWNMGWFTQFWWLFLFKTRDMGGQRFPILIFSCCSNGRMYGICCVMIIRCLKWDI